MRLKARLAVMVLAVMLSGGSFSQSNELGWTLDSALKQLDRQGEDFKTVLADVRLDRIGKDGEASRDNQGRMYMNKDGNYRIQLSSPEPRTVLLDRNNLYRYNPTEAIVEQYGLTKHKDRLEKFTRLGFSYTGSELKKDFLVTVLGEDEIDSRRVIGLELTPKKEKDREVVSKIELWIDQSSWLPVRQVIAHTPSAQSLTTTYSGMARNLELNPDLFRTKWPKGTKKIRR